MNDKINEKIINIKRSDWRIRIIDLGYDENGEEVAENVFIENKTGKFFYATIVEAGKIKTVFSESEGKVLRGQYRKLMFIEKKKKGSSKIGDVVITLRRNPHTKRYMVQVEEEDHYISETEIIKVIRTNRSSVDNPQQAVDRNVKLVGDIDSNSARIGGEKIRTHYEKKGWGPQKELPDKMMDVYEYVKFSPDAMGIATLLKSLQDMPSDIGKKIFAQIQDPPKIS